MQGPGGVGSVNLRSPAGAIRLETEHSLTIEWQIRRFDVRVSSYVIFHEIPVKWCSNGSDRLFRLDDSKVSAIL